MRTLGPGSISSFLKVILDVAWYLLWACAGVLVILAVAALLFSFSRETLAGLDLPEQFKEVRLLGPTLAAALAAGAIYAGGILLIVGNLRRIFSTLTTGDPFHPDNVARLRLIGLILAGLEVGRTVFGWIGAMIIPDSDLAIRFSLTAWFSVMVVFVLAEVFREGARLRREAELTI